MTRPVRRVKKNGKTKSELPKDIISEFERKITGIIFDNFGESLNFDISHPAESGDGDILSEKKGMVRDAWHERQKAFGALADHIATNIGSEVVLTTDELIGSLTTFLYERIQHSEAAELETFKAELVARIADIKSTGDPETSEALNYFLEKEFLATQANLAETKVQISRLNLLFEAQSYALVQVLEMPENKPENFPLQHQLGEQIQELSKSLEGLHAAVSYELRTLEQQEVFLREIFTKETTREMEDPPIDIPSVAGLEKDSSEPLTAQKMVANASEAQTPSVGTRATTVDDDIDSLRKGLDHLREFAEYLEKIAEMEAREQTEPEVDHDLTDEDLYGIPSATAKVTEADKLGKEQKKER